ncbi:hypothetical protein [Campylobacter sputorum]|uniref:hypothetical protein n=1 Tax=Campylobacter sputorum TaxID=206 RepID=UPI00053BE635|nr:hypothetical protein [Campylobacter sputorum]
MKVAELYSVICVIFATNFRNVIDKEHFSKMSKNWIVKNDNVDNIKGHECWEKAVENESLEMIKKDFESLKDSFDTAYFKFNDEKKVNEFFGNIKFKKPFDELSSSHMSNILALLSAILKQDKDEKSHTLLGYYLSEYFIYPARELSLHLQKNANSNYYKAMGYFLADFCHLLKTSLGLKA